MNNTFQNTNFYNSIMTAYEAGKSDDVNSRDALIRNLNSSLNDSCKTYVTDPNIVSNVLNRENPNEYINLEMYLGKYKNDIEFQNSVREQILADEETYFVNKYGSAFYKALTDKRSEMMATMDANTSTCPSGTASTNSSANTSQCPQITPSTCPSSIIIHDLSGNYDSSGNFIPNPSLNNEIKAQFYNLFSKYLPVLQPDVDNRKIEYRETEHDFLTRVNTLVNSLYYILFILMFIILIGGNNLQWKERAPIYIFLFLLPFLYPYFFRMLRFSYNYITNSPEIHGPKNAFLDTNGENNIIDAYNN